MRRRGGTLLAGATSFLERFHHSGIQIPNPQAFAFLPKCSAAEFDFTSAQPFPRNSRAMMQNVQQKVDDKSFDYLVKGISRGEPQVLDVCRSFFNDGGIPCGSGNVALNANGILPAISQVYRMLRLGSGDRVVVPTPTFGFYFQQFHDEGVGYKIYETKKEEGFYLDPERLDKILSEIKSTKVILLNRPTNPTGKITTPKEAEDFAEVVKKHDAFVISDEIFYKNYIKELPGHYPIAAVPGMLERSITFTSITKLMGFPRFRMSFCCGPAEVVEHFAMLGGHSLQDQLMLMAALENNKENCQFVVDSRDKYLANIDLINEKIQVLNQRFGEIFGQPKEGEEAYVKPYIDPEAGNVYLLDFSGLRGKMRHDKETHEDKEMSSGLDVAKWMLDDASVGMVPGECFMLRPEEMLVRIALGHDPREISKAFDKIIAAAEKIRERNPAVMSEGNPDALRCPSSSPVILQNSPPLSVPHSSNTTRGI